MSAEHSPTREEDGLTLTILGCGTLGTAILAGILSSLQSPSSAPSSDPLPPRLPNKFVACVRSKSSATRIRKALDPYASAPSSVLTLINDNVHGVELADVIILGCKPYMVASLLGNEVTNPAMHAALKGKLLLSICAGLTAQKIALSLFDDPPDYEWAELLNEKNGPRIVRAMPNTASLVRESMTVLQTPTIPLPDDVHRLTTWIFAQVGKVVWLPSTASFDAPTALCGSGPAFCALMIEALADGGVAMGLPRKEAITMAAQTMRGAAGLVLAGEHPAVVKDQVGTPGGCTLGGLMVLEEGGARGVISRAVREAATVAAEMGGGKAGGNATRRG